jgi:hypothetical protein
LPWYWTDEIDQARGALGLAAPSDPTSAEALLVAIRRPETSIEELVSALEDEGEPPLAA